MKKLCNSLFNFLKKLLIKYVNRKYKYNVEGLIKLLHLQNNLYIILDY